MARQLRRPLCRLLFVLLCVLPTLWICAWILVRNGPGQAQRFAQALSARIGLRVELADLRYPRPGVTEVNALKLLDPESHQVVARVERLTVAGQEDRMLLDAWGTVVARDQLPRLWELLHQRVLRQTDELPDTVTLASRELTLRDPQGDVVLRAVGGQLERIDAGPKSTWRFSMPKSSELVHLALTRDRRPDRPVTRLDLVTGTTALPCSMFRAFCPALSELGQRSTFRGNLWTQRSANGWEGEIAGEVAEIDLEPFVGQRSIHQLSGRAHVKLEELRFAGSRIEKARGTIVAGPGDVSASLLNAAVRAMELVPAGQLPASDDSTIAYRSLDMRFLIDASGLTLHGTCGEPGSGVVMVDSQGPLLMQPRQPTMPVVNLVRALVPDRQLQVPATRQTVSLLRVLPIPPLSARIDGAVGRSFD